MMRDRLLYLSRLREIDWDFAGTYSESPFSATHWHPGRFVSQVPAALIGLLSEPGQVVLDPFAGSGTTLVEAQRLGRPSIGIDISPISCLISQAKTIDLPAKEIGTIVDILQNDASFALTKQAHLSASRPVLQQVPTTVQLTKWYTPRVANDLSILWSLIGSYSTELPRLLARFSFSAILMSVCRETRHWGYVCDNTDPKDEHEEDVLDSYSSILERLREAYKRRDEEMLAKSATKTIPNARMICEDALQALNELESQSVDLVVTSPPYFGVCDYIKAQRLTIEWEGWDLEALRLREVGARSKRRRLKAQQEYLDEINRVLCALSRALIPGGLVALLIGESTTRSAVLADLMKALDRSSFRVILDLNRTVSSQRRQMPSIRGEHLLILEYANE